MPLRSSAFSVPSASKRSTKGTPRPRAAATTRTPPQRPRSSPTPPATDFEPPDGFALVRETPLGRHPILEVFPGLDLLETAARQVRDPKARAALHRETEVEIVRGDVWMYVAPREIPKWARARWKPVASPDTDCIVIGHGHLTESPALTLFLDIFHELCHVLQRQAGRELFAEGLSYVERTTEIDAYQFVVDEARRLGVSDAVLRDYLLVEWIDETEFRQLLRAVGVSAPP
jgi:hypothetical protein